MATLKFKKNADQIDVEVGGIVVGVFDGTGLKTGAGKRLAQRQRLKTSAVASGSTPVPVDNTKPQITEGDQYMAVTVTPTVIGSTLKVFVRASFGINTADRYLVGSIFRDAVVDALETSLRYQAIVLGSPSAHVDVYTELVTTSLTPITFRFRAGPHAAATVYLNGDNSGGLTFNGAGGSHMLVEEYLP